jgi:uncharacterized protein
MPTVWALSDLHLSLSGAKPMDVFGGHWERHHERMAEAWDRLVGNDDIVLSPGDLSWAMKPAEAKADLDWVGARPGWKVIAKGNHDYWWSGTRKAIAAVLPPRTVAIKKSAARIGGIGFFGARGGDFAPLTRYGDKRSDADIETWLAREEAELKLSIAELDRLDAEAGLPRGQRICVFHYPPVASGKRSSRFTPLISAAGASWCVYGHLHGQSIGPARVEGAIDGVEYRCASCDLIGFEPLRICDF